MIEDKEYSYKENLRVLKKNKLVILGNRTSGKWLKISKQCFDILNAGVESKYTVEELLNDLADDSDREYFRNLFLKLDDLDIIKYSDETELPQRRVVNFAITHRCNLNCKHCCVDADTLNESEYMSTDEIISVLDKIIVSNPSEIVLTGGEAMVRNDFFQILKYIRDNFSGRIILMTNATLINQDNVLSLISYVDRIEISLDGIDEETCSMIRGKGVFDIVIRNIKLLQDNNFTQISVSMVLTKENNHLREKFIELNKKLGTKAVPRTFSPTGRGEVNEEQLTTINQKKLQPERYVEEHLSEEILQRIKMCHCNAVTNTIYIDYKGDIFPCGILLQSKFNMGNVFEIKDFKSFYENKTYLQCKGYEALLKIQPDKYEFCKDCDVNFFCWNCLHYLDIYGDNKELMNERCMGRKRELQRYVWGK